MHAAEVVLIGASCTEIDQVRIEPAVRRSEEHRLGLVRVTARTMKIDDYLVDTPFQTTSVTHAAWCCGAA